MIHGYWFDWRRQSARRAARQREQERRQAEERQTWIDALVAAAVALGLLLSLLVGLLVSGSGKDDSIHVGDALVQQLSADSAGLIPADFTDMSALERHVDSSCSARFDWPVSNVQINQSFDRPITPWAPGHRGVDLIAGSGETITAPHAGTISFAGRVGGKDVVSIRHRGGVTSTFEPATTDLTLGSAVSRGEIVGTVEGDSDHCESHCLHWGLKRGADDYLNPERYAASGKIVLKE
ncbi:M23 family metallopeptidase [Bifidobacterium felsineum]|uniref:Peptidase M23 n=1 Tax=Bifidobacterium felsineum TaxID=2045440 RepID=A0A2M9HK39_9BIFI|nr:peptidoglycan DD-metalloendopeptidase family protein [Bifidobacterium felsineum]MBT1165088.1 M23 family metallopeptidase [Bifidobacterium felsineum]PJM77167.1 peptidase M23 [Bifidobacterium felsineum]